MVSSVHARPSEDLTTATPATNQPDTTDATNSLLPSAKFTLVRRQDQPYIHGSKLREQRRLSGLNELLNQACLRELALKGGESVLDVGSGLGQFTRTIATAVQPNGRVLGIERDAKQLAEARRQARASRDQDLVEWRQGDAAALPLKQAEWGGFDVAYTRFVLEHVREPEKVVRQMAKAVRRGGRVILADDDHEALHLWPESPGFAELWQTYLRAFEHLGCDPCVGRRLVALLHEAGVRPLRNNWIFFGSCAADRQFPAFVRNLTGVIETARNVITGPLGFGPKQFQDALRAIRRWSRRPDAAIWYSLCWAEGVRP